MAAYLDHIGIAVTENSPLGKLLETLGISFSGQEIVEREQVETLWYHLPAIAGHVELLKPTSPDSTIGKFLQKTGKDGIHHLSFRVDDISAVSAKLQQAGFRLIYPQAKPGAHDCLVNFIHPQTTGGVLVEISQKN